MVMIGILMGCIGTDINTGTMRFTFGLTFLYDGIGMVSVALGCFGLAEIVRNLDKDNTLTPFNGNVKLIPSWANFKRIIPSALRGSAVGSFLGIIPGGGTVMAQFGAYAAEKKLSKYKDEIGSGSIEGLAGPSAADEAAARTGFIPLLALGLPENAVMSVILAALMIKGIQPGPQLITQHPDLYWGLIASMWIGNVFLVILNVPLVKMWLSVFKIPYHVLFPCVLFFCCLGTYSINNNVNDVLITSLFGILGYLFIILDLEATPLILGFILGPMLEENLRRFLIISRGDYTAIAQRPVSGTLLAIAVALVVINLVKYKRNKY